MHGQVVEIPADHPLARMFLEAIGDRPRTAGVPHAADPRLVESMRKHLNHHCDQIEGALKKIGGIEQWTETADLDWDGLTTRIERMEMHLYGEVRRPTGAQYVRPRPTENQAGRREEPHPERGTVAEPETEAGYWRRMEREASKENAKLIGTIENYDRDLNKLKEELATAKEALKVSTAPKAAAAGGKGKSTGKGGKGKSAKPAAKPAPKPAAPKPTSPAPAAVPAAA